MTLSLELIGITYYLNDFVTGFEDDVIGCIMLLSNNLQFWICSTSSNFLLFFSCFQPFSQQLGSPLFPGTPLHFHSNYFTYHGPATRTPQGFSRPTRMGSGITINSPKTEDSSDLETIDECTPFTNGTPTPKTAKFKGLLKPQSKLFRRRAKSFDVRDNKTSHPV